VVEEDPERQFDSVCQAIRSALASSRMDAAQVAGVGIDGQMAGVVGVGRSGRNVTPYDSWLDTRCAEFIEKMSRSAGDEVLAKTGGPVSFNHGPKILWWMHTRPAVYRRIVAFVQPAGYVVMRLCGLGASEAFIDKTYLHFSGFADNRAGRWDHALCKRFSLDIAKLPRIVDCCELVGELTRASAARCGLKPGTPVVAGCGDTAASFLSAGAADVGVTVDVRISPGPQGSHAFLRAIRDAGFVAPVCLHQWRRDEPGVVPQAGRRDGDNGRAR
jgi:xylulokinase